MLQALLTSQNVWFFLTSKKTQQPTIDSVSNEDTLNDGGDRISSRVPFKMTSISLGNTATQARAALGLEL